ncbi:MAG: hypothetical protein ACPF84_07730, partial [Flavobacteriales bacterium]
MVRTMVHSHPQRDILPAGSPASDWCAHPETLHAFWPFAGNTPGIAAAIAAGAARAGVVVKP